jgi:hypothetical protein
MVKGNLFFLANPCKMKRESLRQTSIRSAGVILRNNHPGAEAYLKAGDQRDEKWKHTKCVRFHVQPF